MGAASGNDLAATLGRHARTEAVAALANQLARLIRPLHGTSPVEWGQRCSKARARLVGMGLPPKLSRKNDQRPKKSAVSLRAYEGTQGQSQRRFGLRAAIRPPLTKL